MNKTKTYKRYKFTVPEMSIIRGPATEANTGSGSYEDLRGTFWAWDWFDDTLSFYKWSGSEFAEVARPASFPELPKAANHIDAAFNTSARRVACYQEDETVSVIQWNNAETAFETVGPFTGVDPLLYNDVDFFEDPADSDTILFYLTTDRSALKARLERDQYGIEYDIVSFDLPGFLFQVARDDLALKFAIILEDGTVQYWTSGNYAIKASDTLTGAFTLQDWTVETLVIRQDAADTLTGAFTLQDWTVETLVIRENESDFMTAAFTLDDWSVETLVIRKNDTDTLTAAFTLGDWTEIDLADFYFETDTLTGAFTLGDWTVT